MSVKQRNFLISIVLRNGWWQICLIIALSSCCFNNQRAPAIELPSNALAKSLEEASTDPLIEITDTLPDEWWQLFQDPQLNEFILKTFANNPTLHQAQANIFLAAAQAKLIRSKLYPNITWGADVLRQKFSETGLGFSNGGTGASIPATGGKDGIPVYFTQYETELNLSYEFDIWHKNLNALRAAIGEFYANIADEAFARLQLGIALAQTYFQLQINFARQNILQAIVNNQNQYQELVNQRVSSSLDNYLNFHSAKTNLATVKEALLEVQGDMAINEYQLKAYLADNFEEDISQINVSAKPLPKVPLPKDIPLHLIARRPDIITQRWLIKSASRKIDVAKAGFYPDFSLTGLVGFQSLRFSQLFWGKSSYFNVDPAVSLPIFDGGRLAANLQASEINYDLAVFHYNQLVLNATRDVLSGIAVLRNRELLLQETKNRFEQYRDIQELSKQREKYSLDSGLTYLSHEQNMLIAQDQEVVALGNTIQAILSLIKALGGGYEAYYVDPCYANPPPHNYYADKE